MALSLALGGCIDVRVSYASDGPIPADTVTCLRAVGLGPDDGQTHSREAARCIRAFVGLDGNAITPQRLAELPGRGFRCARDAAGPGETCRFSFSETVSVRNSPGGGRNVETNGTTIVVSFAGARATRIVLEQTSRTTFPDPARNNALNAYSANLIND